MLAQKFSVWPPQNLVFLALKHGIPSFRPGFRPLVNAIISGLAAGPALP
jgi:hypothetical protein